MEERTIDNEELRKVRLTRTGGVTDVVDDTLPEETAENAAADEENYVLESDGETLDDALVGLTPAQYRAEIERRERAAREAHAACEKLCDEGESRLAAQEWEAAEERFGEAFRTEPQNARAQTGLWSALTRGYTSGEVFATGTGAAVLEETDMALRDRLREQFGSQLRAERAALSEEAAPLRAAVEAGQAERRGPFLANRNYYLLRLGVCIAVTLACIAGVLIAASFLLRVQNALPIVFTGVFGLFTLASLAAVAVFARRTLVAFRLCRENERLSSTEEGERLMQIEDRIACLSLSLDAMAPQEEDAARGDGAQG